VVLVEECCFDRSILSHKVNLFDMHHKYVDVMHVDEVVAHLDAIAFSQAWGSQLPLVDFERASGASPRAAARRRPEPLAGGGI
jgi:hypothetical protein